MTSPFCPQDSLTAADPGPGGASTRPAVPVARRHLLPVSFIKARVRLVNLISGGSLVPASIDAYACGLPKLERQAPADALSVAALLRVRIQEPDDAAGLVVLPLRWHAIGAGGELIRVLNADLMLIAAQADRTLLRLQGAFRLPFPVAGPGRDGDDLLLRAATASVSFLLDHVRASLAGPAPGVAGA